MVSGSGGRKSAKTTADASPSSGAKGSDSEEWPPSRCLSAAALELKLYSTESLKNMGLAVERAGEERVNEILLQITEQTDQKGDDNPSDLTRHNAARAVQFANRGPLFVCYRGPPQARPIVPLALVEKGFFDFRLNAQATSEVEEVDIVAAQDLWNMCSLGWEDQVKQMAPAVNALFDKYLGRYVTPAGIDGKACDGLVEDSMILFEYKLQPADGYFQGLDYLRRRFLLHKDTPSRRRSHGLLILVACPYIQVVAVVMDWAVEKVVAEPLTGFVNCFGAEEFDLPVLAATLRAIRLFFVTYKPDSVVHPTVPFMYQNRVIQQLDERLVFLVGPERPHPGESSEVEKPKPARVGKLTRHYSKEAHEGWAAANVAPALHCVVDIGGGWKQVEMAYLGPEDGWQKAKQVLRDRAHDPEATAKLTESIKAAAVKGHATGYVHGDLRLPNIKIRPIPDDSFDVMFYDFDWAGKVGEATYPAVLNPEHSWHPEAGYKKSIKPEHDLHFVNNLLGQLPK